MSPEPTPTPTHQPSGMAPVDSPVPVRTTARIVGILVFLLGILLLCYVFWSANNLLHTPAPAVAPATSAGTNGDANSSSAALDLGHDLANFGQHCVVLLVLCVVGGTVASVGIRLFFHAGRRG